MSHSQTPFSYYYGIWERDHCHISWAEHSCNGRQTTLRARVDIASSIMADSIPQLQDSQKPTEHPLEGKNGNESLSSDRGDHSEEKHAVSEGNSYVGKLVAQGGSDEGTKELEKKIESLEGHNSSEQMNAEENSATQGRSVEHEQRTSEFEKKMEGCSVQQQVNAGANSATQGGSAEYGEGMNEVSEITDSLEGNSVVSPPEQMESSTTQGGSADHEEGTNEINNRLKGVEVAAQGQMSEGEKEQIVADSDCYDESKNYILIDVNKGGVDSPTKQTAEGDSNLGSTNTEENSTSDTEDGNDESREPSSKRTRTDILEDLVEPMEQGGPDTEEGSKVYKSEEQDDEMEVDDPAVSSAAVGSEPNGTTRGMDNGTSLAGSSAMAPNDTTRGFDNETGQSGSSMTGGGMEDETSQSGSSAMAGKDPNNTDNVTGQPGNAENDPNSTAGGLDNVHVSGQPGSSVMTEKDPNNTAGGLDDGTGQSGSSLITENGPKDTDRGIVNKTSQAGSSAMAKFEPKDTTEAKGDDDDDDDDDDLRGGSGYYGYRWGRSWASTDTQTYRSGYKVSQIQFYSYVYRVFIVYV